MGRSRKRRPDTLTQYLGQGRKKSHLTRPSDLSDFARSVLGLWHLGIIDPLEITGVLWVQEQHNDHALYAREWHALQDSVEYFLHLVYTLKHPVTEYILDHGLPRGCGAFLPEGKVVHCPTCRHLLNAVPCVLCTDPALQDSTLVKHKGQYERPPPTDGLPVPKYATCALPGSQEKIEVMRRRASRRETCFHPQDQPLVANVDQGFWG